MVADLLHLLAGAGERGSSASVRTSRPRAGRTPARPLTRWLPTSDAIAGASDRRVDQAHADTAHACR